MSLVLTHRDLLCYSHPGWHTLSITLDLPEPHFLSLRLPSVYNSTTWTTCPFGSLGVLGLPVLGSSLAPSLSSWPHLVSWSGSVWTLAGTSDCFLFCVYTKPAQYLVLSCSHFFFSFTNKHAFQLKSEMAAYETTVFHAALTPYGLSLVSLLQRLREPSSPLSSHPI